MEVQKNKEIDVVALGLKVLKEWKLLAKFVVVAAIIGVIVALSTPKTYTSEVVLAPEMSSGGLGLSDNLAEMASTFGVDLGGKSSMDAIYPELYPDIFSSYDFSHKMLDVPVRLKDDNTTRPYVQHLLKDTKNPFWVYPLVWIKKLMKKPESVPASAPGFVDPYRVSKDESELCEVVVSSIVCLVDKKTSEIVISFTDQDPMVAAIMVDTLLSRLQTYIIDYRTKKARVDYEYYSKMTQDAEEYYHEKQAEYIEYSDSHSGSQRNFVMTQSQLLKNNMDNAYMSYSGMLKLREQALARIQERIPAFTIIQSSKMPNKASSRPRIVTVFIFVLLSVFVGSFYIIHKHRKELFKQS